ncbi:Cse1-domain-containing protein [Cristinia sonorae]|uniref:Cse1-domain-containing protein n=1 Tax=Cristinia sonorae TaxID=1940300 RepID=A0A8K0URN5_9AGAR|nr:Cse1-domain-containing protein [Cristinia sonorae]
MSDISSLLLASLSPATRKQAEVNLQSVSVQPAFLPHLLRLVLEPSQDRSVRLAGSLYFKNVTKKRWDYEETPIPEADKATLRNELVPAMIALSNPSDKAIRVQIAESISIIASQDFPEQWPTLVDNLVSSLSDSNYSINVGVLQTAHSIFQSWRSATRSNELFTIINYVLERFGLSFVQLFRHTANLLFSGATSSDPNSSLQLVAQAQVILVEILYDLTCQDLPPLIEDSHAGFFSPSDGLLLRFLAWDPESLRVEPDETTPSLPSQVKTGILEIAELYIKLYPEVLQTAPTVEAMVRSVWDLVGGGQRSGVADDGLVSQSLRFISTAIRSGYYKDLFSSKDTISSLVQGVVVPNIALREHEIEQFEDDPLEYIRLDLSLPASSGGLGLGSHDAVTRRQAAADVIRALVSSGLDAETTEVASVWVNRGLQEYAANKSSESGWKAKDTAVYLLTAVATRGSTTQQGVTSTNKLVDVVQFFSEHVFQDLQADVGSVHPVLQVDAIRFLHTFRTQLTKEQLLSVLPLLVRHLSSDNYVCYTYAAISIERILFIRQGTQLLFSQADVQEIAPPIINALLAKIESAPTPEKVAENDYLMKCIMRVIITSRSSLASSYEGILRRLVAILGVISRNPSNPNFDQYIFESISAFVRFVVGANRGALPAIEQALFGPCTVILQQDVEQYIPYVFQLFAQMLDMHTDTVPAAYRELLSFLLTPASWQQKGSIPGLVKLLKAFLARDTAHVISTGQYTAILAVIQQRLIPSKLNDVWGFELLQSVVQTIPLANLKDYFKALVITLLTRVQTSKTDKYVYNLAYFFLFTIAINADGLTPDFLIGVVESIQPNLWSQILSNFVIPQIPQILPRDRKVAAVGLTRLLTSSTLMLQEPLLNSWVPCTAALVKLISQPLQLKKETGVDPDAGLTAIDYEEQTAGYQAAYSRLAASETEGVDPVAAVRDPREFFGQELVQLSKSGAPVRQLVTVDPAVKVFVDSLAATGYTV